MASTIASLSRANRQVLLSCARDPARWEAYLRVLAQHVGCGRRQNNQSVLNCAALLESGWGDTSEAMTLEEWRGIPGCSGAEVAEGAVGIEVIKAKAGKGSGLFHVQTIWPATALTGLDAERPDLGAPQVDLDDKASRSAWETALSRLSIVEPDGVGGETRRPVSLTDFAPTVQFVVLTRFGIAAAGGCPLPPDSVADDARRLKDFCNNVSRDATNLSVQIERTYRSRLAHERRRLEEVRLMREGSLDAGRKAAPGPRNGRFPAGGDADGCAARERDMSRAKPRRRADSQMRKFEPVRKPFLPHGIAPAEAYSYARKAALETANKNKAPGGKDKGGAA